MKKTKLGIIVLSIATIGILYYVLKDDYKDIYNILINTNILYMFLAFLLMIVSDLFRSLVLYVEVKVFNDNFKYIEAYKLNWISNFFNCITPFFVGGEPYQAYYLNKNHRISYAKTTSIIFQNFFVRQTALIIICAIFIILNSIFKFISIDSFLLNLILVGLAFNVIVVIILILISNDRKGKNSLIRKIIRFLGKIKILNERVLERINNYLNNFYESQDYMKDQKNLFIKSVIYSIISIILVYLIPLFVFNALGINNLLVITSLIATIFIGLVCFFVPLPGGTVGYEYGFITFFGFILNGPILKIGMLLWRFVTYYFLIIVGSIVFIMSKRRKVIR